jgi:hypothetical protein
MLHALPGFKYVAIGDPVQKRHFYRTAWAIFDSEESVQRAVSSLVDQKASKVTKPFTPSYSMPPD